MHSEIFWTLIENVLALRLYSFAHTSEIGADFTFVKSCETGHRRPKLITSTRTWLLLASGVVLQTVIYKGLYGIDRFFLKEIKNVMFLNKIDLPYCLVVFFVVCPRLRPFWRVFGKLTLFWCSTAKRKTMQNSDFRSVRRSRRIIPLENYPRPQFSQEFKAEMLQFHVHSVDSQFLPQIVH